MPVHFQDRKPAPGLQNLLTRFRNVAKMRKQEAGKGLKPGVGRQLDPILSREIADWNGAFHLHLRRLRRGRRPQDIVLVIELSEDLFQDILECHQPRDSAELVHHQGHIEYGPGGSRRAAGARASSPERRAAGEETF